MDLLNPLCQSTRNYSILESQKARKVSRNSFHPGTFRIHPYTIRVCFDQMRSLHAHIRHISNEQLKKLYTELQTYDISVVKLKNAPIRVRFSFKPKNDLKEEKKEMVGSRYSHSPSLSPSLASILKLVSLPDSFRTRKIMEDHSEVLSYADTVTKNPAFKEVLFTILERSKTDVSFAIAASNSITILNAARVSFSGLDLAGIQVPGAYLEGAIFDGTILDGANLSRTTLVDAFLGDCSLKKTQLDEVQFGQLPNLKHEDEMNDIAISSDGRWLVSSSIHKLYLWDMQVGKKLRVFKESMSHVFGCALSPNGKWMTSVGLDHGVRLWNLQGEKDKYFWHKDWVRSCAFSPDGKWLASVCDNTVLLWDIENENESKIFEGHTEKVEQCAFSPDGKWLASFGPGHIRIWDLLTRKGLKILNLERPRFFSGSFGFFSFSPNGKWIAAPSGDAIRIWDFETEKEIQNFKVYNATSCAFSPNGKWLAITRNYPGSVQIWDIMSGRKIKESARDSVNVHSCVFFPDGKWLAFCQNNEVCFLDLQMKQEMKDIKAEMHVSSCAFSPNGNWIATAADWRCISLRDLRSGKELKSFKHEFRIAAFSPDGKWVSLALGCQISICDLQTGKVFLKLKYPSEVRSCAFSPDSKWLISSALNIVYFFDLQKRLFLQSFREIWTSKVNYLAFSPDSKRIVFVDGTYTIWIWDVEKREWVKRLEGHNYRITSCSFSPDGKRIASTSDDGTARLWDLNSGEELMILNHQKWTGFNFRKNRVTSCTFSPDSKYLATVCWRDKAIRIWDLETGEVLKKLEGHTRLVSSCAFSLDGKWLSSGSWDNSLRLWKLYDDNGHLNPRLEWTTLPIFAAPRANIKDAEGLTPFNRLLLLQKGAYEEEGDDSD